MTGLGPMAGYPVFVVVTGGIVTGHPVRTVRVGGDYAGAETGGQYEADEGKFDIFKPAVVRKVRKCFHDFKFEYWMERGRGSLMGYVVINIRVTAELTYRKRTPDVRKRTVFLGGVG
jgi:hypothetical protein